MASEIEGKVVPEHHEGTQKDIDHTVTAPDKSTAQKIFLIGKDRLTDVNHWDEFCGSPSSTFTLTDAYGNEVNRVAQEGDYFKIKIPAPGPSSGDGYDWVLIETIEDNSDHEAPLENIAMRVRPSSNPQSKGENISHFFSNKATSSFVVSRHQNRITAAVYGRNETPNTSSSNAIDKVRNTIVAITAMLGLSNIQWDKLVKGLIPYQE